LGAERTDSESAARWRGPTACRGRQKPARQTFRSVSTYRRRRASPARASRLPKAFSFAAPASPAAARPSHDPPNATRSLPFRPETRVSGRLPADQRHPAGPVHVEPLHGRQDVAVDHVVLGPEEADGEPPREVVEQLGDRKSTRLNSSHEWISYAVFCLKKK